MRDATTLLVQYAQYHRDRRNLATHLVGIPLIVVSIGVLLAIRMPLAGQEITWAAALWGVTSLWYFSRRHVGAAVAVVLLNALCFALGHWVALQVAPLAWAWGVGLFVVGWAFQFLGHVWEGRKPAFVDDLVGLLVGPLFVAVELWAMVGGAKDLMARMEAEAGPMR